MAEPKSPVSRYRAVIDENVDMELLVAEVKCRPELTSSEINFDIETKEKLWSEVCEVLFPLWNNYDTEKKSFTRKFLYL